MTVQIIKYEVFILFKDIGPDVANLRKELLERNIDTKPITEQSKDIKVLILCLTSEDCTGLLYNIMDREPNIKILPALFIGGKKPVILGDIREANFINNWNEALVLLIKAIERFC